MFCVKDIEDSKPIVSVYALASFIALRKSIWGLKQAIFTFIYGSQSHFNAHWTFGFKHARRNHASMQSSARNTAKISAPGNFEAWIWAHSFPAASWFFSPPLSGPPSPSRFLHPSRIEVRRREWILFPHFFFWQLLGWKTASLELTSSCMARYPSCLHHVSEKVGHCDAAHSFWRALDPHLSCMKILVQTSVRADYLIEPRWVRFQCRKVRATNWLLEKKNSTRNRDVWGRLHLDIWSSMQHPSLVWENLVWGLASSATYRKVGGDTVCHKRLPSYLGFPHRFSLE